MVFILIMLLIQTLFNSNLKDTNNHYLLTIISISLASINIQLMLIVFTLIVWWFVGVSSRTQKADNQTGIGLK